ncbi:tyrosine-type recombinase/integrase [Pseudomonas fulva]|uniref:tyrosine-type recombinase/integrase n=1 Tax=Pseudomonas fulva TaxID=47880 RepID=UPI000B73A490|nr:phage integrase family protein [Pseudomonas sp. URIL14HWK12:I1]SNB79653.1 Phage integrase family protein [Pseudomonas sp. LAIL14HWK12:I4]
MFGSCCSRLRPAQKYVFYNRRDLTDLMSENTLNTALHRMGYAGLLNGHGMRGTLSTALHEFGYPKAWIDAQLSHAAPDRIRSAYNHAEYVEQRQRMMQDWADRLDLCQQGEIEAATRQLTIYLEGVALESEFQPNGYLALSSSRASAC